MRLATTLIAALLACSALPRDLAPLPEEVAKALVEQDETLEEEAVHAYLNLDRSLKSFQFVAKANESGKKGSGM
jgi:hypothetical protein